MMTGRLADRIVIVTGGGRGYGACMAEAIAQEGGTVVVASRTPTECDAVAKRICDSGGNALPVVADIADTGDVVAMVATALNAFGRVDVLINNAAHPGPVGSTVDLDEAVWQETLDVNLTGSFRCIQAVLPGMIARGSGHIVNLSSGTARLGYRHIRSLGYTTSKFAIEGFSSNRMRFESMLSPRDWRKHVFCQICRRATCAALSASFPSMSGHQSSICSRRRYHRENPSKRFHGSRPTAF